MTALQGFEFRGQDDSDNVGRTLSAAGDVNNDGLPDIIINTSDFDLSPTSAVVIFGVPSVTAEIDEFEDDGESLALVQENTTAVIVATSLGEGTTFTLGGEDADLFEINQETGFVSFIDAPDFESVLSDEDFADILSEIDDPEDLEDFGFDLEILASNGDISAIQEVAVTIIDVNEFAPEFTVLPDLATSNGRYFILAEDRDGTPIALADIGDDGRFLFDDALTYEITGGTDAALFELEVRDGGSGFAGRLTFIDAPAFDAPTDANGDGLYNVEISISDGEFVTAQTFNLSVVEGGTDPIFTGPVAFTVDEFSSALVGQIAGEDPDGAEVNYTLSFDPDASQSTPDNFLFDIDFFTGELSFRFDDTVPSFLEPRDENGDNVYELTVSITDGTDRSFETVTVTVNDVEFAPILIGPTELEISENNPEGLAAFVTAQDRDADEVTATISGGADSGFFTIAPVFFPETFGLTPNLSFDFENPLDANGDNIYEVEVTFSDGENETVELIEFVIFDVFESPNAPIFTTPDTVQVNEGESFVISVNADDADGETPFYFISGGENQFDFFINDFTGDISFFGPVRFNQPNDFGDNFYTIEVTADDGSNNLTTQTLQIEVVDIDVAPTLNTPIGVVVDEGFGAGAGESIAFVSASENFDNQMLTISLQGEDAAAFTLVGAFNGTGFAQGALQFNEAPDFENPADADGDNIYLLSLIHI